jgi:hypothetical protein
MKKEYIFWIVSGIFAIVALLGLGSSVYFFRQYRVSEEQRFASLSLTPKDTEAVLSKVRKLVLLPSEEAKIMTVANVAELKKTQRFFAEAEDGDIVLVFENAKKAVVYRPSVNLVVNIAPILPGGQASDSAKTVPTAVQMQPLKIALRNGTTVVDMNKKLEDELKLKVQNVVITEKDNAKRANYEKTELVILNDTLNRESVQKLADMLSARIITLPSDEPKPDADLLIIAGIDRK